MVPRGLSARAAANIATQDARLANRMPSDLTYKAEAGLGHVCADRRYTRGSQALFTSSVTRYLIRGLQLYTSFVTKRICFIFALLQRSYEPRIRIPCY
jgi:hypothetical protein